MNSGRASFEGLQCCGGVLYCSANVPLIRASVKECPWLSSYKIKFVTIVVASRAPHNNLMGVVPMKGISSSFSLAAILFPIHGSFWVMLSTGNNANEISCTAASSLTVNRRLTHPVAENTDGHRIKENGL